MKYLIFIISLFFVGHTSLAQSSYPDSLLQLSIGQPLKKEAKIYLQLADYYSRINLDSSIYYISCAKKIAEKSDNNSLRIDCYNSEGLLYQTNTEYAKSTKAYLNATRIGEQKNIFAPLGSSYNGLGINYYYQENYSKAKKYLKKAAQLKFESGEFDHHTTILINLSGIYLFEGDIKTAIELLHPLEPILNKSKDYKSLGNLYNTLGSIHQLGHQDLDSAFHYFNKGLLIGLKHNLEELTLAGYHNVGQVQIGQNRLPEAESNLNKSLILARKRKNKSAELLAYNSLSELCVKKHLFEKALNYKEKELALSKTIFQSEREKTVEEFEVKYQTTKKEKQIVKQRRAIQNQVIKAEKNKNKTNKLLFSAAILILLSLFATLYFWQRKRSKEKLSEFKSRIFHNVVHEIRTPLNLITGPLQLLKNSDPASFQQNIDMAERNAGKLIGLVNELLDASKLEKGKYELQYKQGDLQLFIQSLIQPFIPEFEQKQIDFRFNCEIPRDSIIKFPDNALDKILTNLFSNAIKHCSENGQIVLNCIIKNQLLSIQVKDNGDGIHKKELDKIFDRFYRTAMSEKMPGTGIGLSMLKEIVNLAKGAISVESEITKGTTFNVSIPVEVHCKTVPSNKLQDSNDDRYQILIAEDDPEMASFVASLFSEKFNVNIAQDGEQAIAFIDQKLPDIVLTDVMMPKKDGIAVLRFVKENEISQHIPVIIFSSKASLKNRLETLQHGADSYIPKPFDVNELKLTIDNLLRTIKKNQQDFQKQLETNVPFEERLMTQSNYLNSVVELVIQNIEDTLYSVSELAGDLAISRSQLHRKIIALTGYSTSNFIRKIRLEKSKDLLLEDLLNVTEIAYQCGFNTQSYFTKCFKEEFNISPSDFKNQR